MKNYNLPDNTHPSDNDLLKKLCEFIDNDEEIKHINQRLSSLQKLIQEMISDPGVGQLIVSGGTSIYVIPANQKIRSFGTDFPDHETRESYSGFKRKTLSKVMDRYFALLHEKERAILWMVRAFNKVHKKKNTIEEAVSGISAHLMSETGIDTSPDVDHYKPTTRPVTFK